MMVPGSDERFLWRRAAMKRPTAKLSEQPAEAAKRDAALHRPVEAGLVQERGHKKGRSWHLSAAVYRALGDKAAYVRQRGFEPLQQEQMVVQYVEKHGRITRREAAELCRIASYQARDLLGRLAESGDLLMQGSKKGAFYERGSKDMEESKSVQIASKSVASSPRRGESRRSGK
jgi:ATP-dependent DNA helicase RecG